MRETPQEFSYESMGTRWRVAVWDEIPAELLEDFRTEIMRQSEAFDRTYSRFIRDSLVWKLAERAGEAEVPEDFTTMLSWYRKFYAPSGKKLNPAIGFTISDLGYDAEYSLVRKEDVRKTPDLLEAVAVMDETHIRTSEPVLFDFGALGKGYFIDKIAAFLKEKGMRRFLVDGSGDIFYEGNGIPIRAGLEHPGDATKAVGVVEMRGGALCSSGGNRRVWGEFHHIIDPASLSSPKDVIATWVTADSATLADALATSLFFCPPEAFADFAFEYCILNRDYKAKRSAGFAAELF